ncbi:MAG TPA: hypothetical protein VGR97_06610 [Candidatus Acidoferrales bacterium]|nr:hypothetical protein [Candidatus Acidoferrales bacterium]
MKRIAMLTLLLHLGIAAVYAQEAPVKMTFSGTSAPSTINLPQPNTSSDGDNFAGQGTLGAFTVTNVRAIANYAGTSSTCSGANQLFLSELAGAGVFRFRDGSLLEIALTQGGDCIDLTTNVAHCTVTFHITGGTGRFQHASGALTMTETVNAVAVDTNGHPVADANGNPIFFVATGEFTGTVSGVSEEQGQHEGQ